MQCEENLVKPKSETLYAIKLQYNDGLRFLRDLFEFTGYQLIQNLQNNNFIIFDIK